jgi:hypothetical protein
MTLINATDFIWQVSEVKSWVVDDTTLTHLESLELEMVCLMQLKRYLTT